MFLLQQNIRHVFLNHKKTSTSAFSSHCVTSYHRSYFGDDIKSMIITFEISPISGFSFCWFLMFRVLIELDSSGLPVFKIRASPLLKPTVRAFYDACFFFVWPLITHNCGFFPQLFTVFWPHFCCVGLCLLAGRHSLEELKFKQLTCVLVLFSKWLKSKFFFGRKLRFARSY